MKGFTTTMQKTFGLALIVFLTACAVTQPAPDPLPSWTEGTSKQQIIEFVTSVSNEGGSGYVEPGKRIATFGPMTGNPRKVASTGAWMKQRKMAG